MAGKNCVRVCASSRRAITSLLIDLAMVGILAYILARHGLEAFLLAFTLLLLLAAELRVRGVMEEAGKEGEERN